MVENETSPFFVALNAALAAIENRTIEEAEITDYRTTGDDSISLTVVIRRKIHPMFPPETD